ncbi:TIGR04282 family arsenosugar biosynthesis glycosyltransferase [Quisquiliibacterium transsilvanicum]|uniref:Glycosyltransferase n=1 Tax=Quisquiliibacterium transsilvanicum TaxID=1549638 RepID=A0A7W8M7W3_9BURK|nr:hypothetical protein [Quisquiliibacterium transsilvanicum]
MIVFARAPLRGRVKTRLAAAIGDEAALEAHRALLRATAGVAASLLGHPEFGAGSVELCIDGEDADGECAALARSLGLRLGRQQGEDLGARMHSALARALQDGRLPVLLGSDCPALQAADLLEALAALRRNDAVFAPAEDGGYVLVGLARECPALFQGLAWGGAEVMEQTRARLRAAGIRWTELRTLWDVDRHEDWLRWRGACDAQA